MEEALEEGDCFRCEECEIPCNYDEIYYTGDESLCDQCYDDDHDTAWENAIKHIEVMTHELHKERYGEPMPRIFKGDAYLYHSDGRTKHEDCFMFELSMPGLTPQQAFEEWADQEDPDTVKEFIFSV